MRASYIKPSCGRSEVHLEIRYRKFYGERLYENEENFYKEIHVPQNSCSTTGETFSPEIFLAQSPLIETFFLKIMTSQKRLPEKRCNIVDENYPPCANQIKMRFICLHAI